MREVVILVGFPGCGKSEVALRIYRDTTHLGFSSTIVSIDHHFMQDGRHVYKRSELPVAIEKYRNALNEAMRREVECVIVDNTSLFSRDRQRIVADARSHGYNVHYVQVGKLTAEAAHRYKHYCTKASMTDDYIGAVAQHAESIYEVPQYNVTKIPSYWDKESA